MRSSGAMLFSSAATSSCAIAFRRDSCDSYDRYSNTADASLRGRSRKTTTWSSIDEIGEDRREIARVPVANHVAQARKVACPDHGRKFIGRPCHTANRVHRVIALGTVQLLFHLREGCPDHVVMVHVRANGLHRVEPQTMNEIEIAGRECGRMRAEVIGVGAATVVVNDQPHVLGVLGTDDLFPRLAKPPRLVVGRKRGRFADEHFGGAQPRDGGGERVEDVLRRHDQQPHGPVVALGQGHDLREEPPLVGRGLWLVGRDIVCIDANQTDRHDDDVAVARDLERFAHVADEVWMPDGHENVAGPRFGLFQRRDRPTAGARTRPRRQRVRAR